MRVIPCCGYVVRNNNAFIVDHCIGIVTADTRFSDTKFDRASLMKLSKDCYEAYAFRLQGHGNEIEQIGEVEYKLINAALINLILEYYPLNYSFSISSDPSLHFFVRFEDDVSLGIEIFLYPEGEHNTYVNINKSGKSYYQSESSFDEAKNIIKDTLDALVKRQEIYPLPDLSCKYAPTDLH